MRTLAALIPVVSSLLVLSRDVCADSRDITFRAGSQWKSSDSKLIVTELDLIFDGYNNGIDNTSDMLITRNGSSTHFRAIPAFTQCPPGSPSADCIRCASGGIGRHYWLVANYPVNTDPEFRFMTCPTSADGAFLVKFDGSSAEAVADNNASTIDIDTNKILPPAIDPVGEATSWLTETRNFLKVKSSFKKLSARQKLSLKKLAAPTCQKLQACGK